jgi:hypothetical protein
LVDRFLAMTRLATVTFIDDLAFSATVLADLLHPLNHSRAYLSCDELNALSATRTARLLGAFASTIAEVDIDHSSFD